MNFFLGRRPTGVRCIVVALGLMTVLTACVTRPKPQYDYAGTPDDPVFTLESDFGVDTNFSVQINPDKNLNLCKSRQSVAYMQDMDSYYRSSSLKGPWTLTAPAGQPMVISAGWHQYAVTSPSGKRVTTPARGCAAESKLLVGEKGKQYRAYLRKAADGGCALDITSLEGSPVPTEPYPRCRLR